MRSSRCVRRSRHPLLLMLALGTSAGTDGQKDVERDDVTDNIWRKHETPRRSTCVSGWHANLTDPADEYNDGVFHNHPKLHSDAVRNTRAAYWRERDQWPFLCLNASQQWTPNGDDSWHFGELPPIRVWKSHACPIHGFSAEALCTRLVQQPPGQRDILIVGDSTSGQHTNSLAEELGTITPGNNSGVDRGRFGRDFSICGGQGWLRWRRSDLLDAGNSSERWPSTGRSKYAGTGLRRCPSVRGAKRAMLHCCETWVNDAQTAYLIVLNTGAHWDDESAPAARLREAFHRACAIGPTPKIILRTTIVGVAQYKELFHAAPLDSAASGWHLLQLHPGLPEWGYLRVHEQNRAAVAEAARAECPVDVVDAFPISLMRTDLRSDPYHVCEGSTIYAEVNRRLLATLTSLPCPPRVTPSPDTVDSQKS